MVSADYSARLEHLSARYNRPFDPEALKNRDFLIDYSQYKFTDTIYNNFDDKFKNDILEKIVNPAKESIAALNNTERTEEPSARYKKVQILVSLGLITQEKLDSMMLRFPPSKKQELIQAITARVNDPMLSGAYLRLAFSDKHSGLGLKHFITNQDELDAFVKDIDKLYASCHEVILFTSDIGAKEHYYGRLSLKYGKDDCAFGEDDVFGNDDILEIIRGKSPGLLNKRTPNSETPFMLFRKKSYNRAFTLQESKNADDAMEMKSVLIRNLLADSQKKLDEVKRVMLENGVNSFCPEFFLENGQDLVFIDWDADYEKVLKIFYPGTRTQSVVEK